MPTSDSPVLTFVYNADSGFFNLMADVAHKTFSPSTYPCQLCALTHGAFSMRKDWRDFLNKLKFPMRFLHRDDFRKETNRADELPAIFFGKQGDDIQVLVDSQTIKNITGLEDLKRVIHEKLVLEELM